MSLESIFKSLFFLFPLQHVCGSLAPRTIHLHSNPCPQEVMFLDLLIKLVWQAKITSWTRFRGMGTLFRSEVPHRRLFWSTGAQTICSQVFGETWVQDKGRMSWICELFLFENHIRNACLSQCGLVLKHEKHSLSPTFSIFYLILAHLTRVIDLLRDSCLL